LVCGNGLQGFSGLFADREDNTALLITAKVSGDIDGHEFGVQGGGSARQVEIADQLRVEDLQDSLHVSPGAVGEVSGSRNRPLGIDEGVQPGRWRVGEVLQDSDLDNAVGLRLDAGGLQVEDAQRLRQPQVTEFAIHDVVSRKNTHHTKGIMARCPASSPIGTDRIGGDSRNSAVRRGGFQHEPACSHIVRVMPFSTGQTSTRAGVRAKRGEKEKRFAGSVLPTEAHSMNNRIQKRSVEEREEVDGRMGRRILRTWPFH
jgi:hypothetical protein